MNIFNGKQIRDQILSELKLKIDKLSKKPGLAVICIGDNPVCSKYVSLKKKFADQIGVNIISLSFDTSNTQAEIVQEIEKLNRDKNINGIMIQMPVLDKFDKFEIVRAITPEKDVDGLRFCCSYKSKFKPPVVLAILEAIKQSSVCHSGLDPESTILDPRVKPEDDKMGSEDDNNNGSEDDKIILDCLKGKEVVVVGRGFLVGWPLAQCLEEAVQGLIVVDDKTKNLANITKSADIIISAVGKHDIITPDMIKDGVVLIDAGTTEVSGELRGDINPNCYEKVSFYTPVPGGIGPVTVAMLFRNLVHQV